MSAAIREAIRREAGALVVLWLCSPDGTDRRGRQYRGKGAVSPTAGPLRGRVRLCGIDSDVFILERPDRAVTIAYRQVAMWQEIAPAPPLLPVEEIARTLFVT